MRKNYVKGLVAGVLAASMVIGIPVSAAAYEVEGEQVEVSVEAKAKKAEDTKKPQDTKKPNETKKPVKAKAQEVGKVTCTSSGKVNISFKQKVTYTDALKAVITDENGKEIPCKITKKNKSLLTVTVSGLVKGEKYTLSIEGILGKDSEQAVVVKKVFTAKGMKTQSKVGQASVSGKNFVILKMKSAAYYKDATVEVKNASGSVCEAKIVKKAKGNIKVQITGMKKGETYTITINGIKTKKEKNYGSITKTITVK
ncbi:hypothetical protein C806_03400 [Lachnospiraceae bacterium 3-1]|nr:hypothetical protein C806_03400 [Lachnospiraceae bacterium 3-1]